MTTDAALRAKLDAVTAGVLALGARRDIASWGLRVVVRGQLLELQAALEAIHGRDPTD